MIAITFTVILGMVLGAPLLTCDKIQGESFTHRYKVTLEDPRYAEDVIKLVEKYQNMADPSEIISKLEPFGNELKGSLSKQALLLVSYHDYIHKNICIQQLYIRHNKFTINVHVGMYG